MVGRSVGRSSDKLRDYVDMVYKAEFSDLPRISLLSAAGIGRKLWRQYGESDAADSSHLYPGLRFFWTVILDSSLGRVFSDGLYIEPVMSFRI